MDFKQFYSFKREVFSRVRTVCDLSYINPSLELPQCVTKTFFESVQQANAGRRLGYGPSDGSLDLKLPAVNFWNSLTGGKYQHDNVLLSYGTKDALSLTLKTLTIPGQTVYFEKPTYPVYQQLSRAFNLKPTCDVSKADVVILAAPNNPNGETNFKILDQINSGKNHQVVFFDGVYTPLSRSSREFLKRIRSASTCLVESFSFSKAFGVPGTRVGLIFSDSTTISNLKRARGILDYNVSKLVEIFASSLLSKADDITQAVGHSYKHKFNLVNSFGLSGCIKSEEVLPFVWISHQRINKELWEKLAFHGFLTFWGGFYGSEFSDCLRVSLTAPEVLIARFCQLLMEELGITATRAANA